MTTHTKESLAALLDGMEYPGRISREIIDAAKANGLLIVTGASDDIIQFNGAYRDEGEACNRDTVLIDAIGPLPNWEQVSEEGEEAAELYFQRKPNGRPIIMNWDTDGYSWTYSTDIPHAVFDVMDGGEKYCRGMVIAVADIAGTPLATG